MEWASKVHACVSTCQIDLSVHLSEAHWNIKKLWNEKKHTDQVSSDLFSYYQHFIFIFLCWLETPNSAALSTQSFALQSSSVCTL